jgi:hypothetical protein
MITLQEYLLFSILISLPFIYLAHTVWRLTNELYEAKERLIALSFTLQKVELITKKPWYTSSGVPIKSETAEWLHTFYKEKLNKVLVRRGRRRNQDDVLPNF